MDKAPARFNPPSSSPSAAMVSTSKTNRLRRSSRAASQQPAAGSPQHLGTAHLQSPLAHPAEFKTPTRMPCKYASGFCGESPNNDGEFQQDIVWDASSPSPVRGGKRGKSRRSGAAIGISEIVRRIAPMHGRPEVAEPTVQEWIGDNAAIPCTPEVQHPKAKKKSPRPNGVDDLLKLAKQFDFNMFQQDEKQAQDLLRHTLELLSEDVSDYESGFPEGPRRPLAEPPPPETAVEDAPPARAPQDHNMDDDLELLFDGPTQRISGDLSQLGSAETSGLNSTPARGGPTRRPTPAGPAADDWEDDDLLNDSLVIEMTQNPQRFDPKPASGGTPRDRKPPSRGELGGGCGGVAKHEPRMAKNRTTFKLEANPEFPLPFIVSGTSLADAGAKRNPAAATKENRPTTSANIRVDPAAAHKERRTPSAPLAANDDDFPDEDLDELFSSEPVWDDEGADDLLCQMCEDLESQAEAAERPAALKQRPSLGHTSQRPAPEVGDNRKGRPDATPTPTPAPHAAGRLRSVTPLAAPPARPSVTSFAGNAVSNVKATGTESYRCAPPGTVHVGDSQRRGGAPSPDTTAGGEGRFTFKKPASPLLKGIGAGPEKCSTAEIERKKREALERRRQRLQAGHALRAQT